MDKVVWVAVRRCGHLHQLRPGKAQHVLLFFGLRFGNDDYRLEPHGRPDQCETDPGVTGRALNDRATGLQITAGNRVADDKQRGTVFDGLTRVHEFGLAENFTACFFADATQPDQRCFTDRVGKVSSNAHGVLLSYGIAEDLQVPRLDHKAR